MSESAASVIDTASKPLAALVPMAHVADVLRAIEWYAKLGFVVEGTLTPEGRPMRWAHLRYGGAALMLARTARPMYPDAQDVLFYLYAHGVAAYRDRLITSGLKPGELSFPSYARHGEFSINDLDGYCLLVGDAEQRKRNGSG